MNYIITMFLSLFIGCSSAPLDSYQTSTKTNIFKVADYQGSPPYGTAFSVELEDRIIVVTNAHVCAVSGNKRIIALYSEAYNRWFKAQKVAVSVKYDTCLLKTESHIKHGFKLAEASPDIKDFIYIVGHPNMAPLTVSTGAVLSYIPVAIPTEYPVAEEECRKSYHSWESEEMYPGGPVFFVCFEVRDSYITDAFTRPGSSGSPVLNGLNQVVGLEYAGNSEVSVFMGVAEVKRVISLWLRQEAERQRKSL